MMTVVWFDLQTRPLGLKKADVACISGATYHMLRSSLATSASPLQNGFLFRRNFFNNIVDLDTHARVYSMQPSLRVLLFTDFGAAFPSLIQQWLFLVFQQSGFPSGLISFLEGIHNLVSAVSRSMFSVKDPLLYYVRCHSGLPVSQLLLRDRLRTVSEHVLP